VRARLRMYEDVTRPVLAFYQYRNYHQIRGDRSPSYIFEEITGVLEPLAAAKNGNFERNGNRSSAASQAVDKKLAQFRNE
jgi:hypothetical protein